MEIISRADETRRDETRINQINQSINEIEQSVLPTPDALRPGSHPKRTRRVPSHARRRSQPRTRRPKPPSRSVEETDIGPIRSDPIESIDPRRFDAIIITQAARRGNRFDPIRPGARRGWVRLRLPNGATLRTMKRNERALRGRSGATSVVWRWTTGGRSDVDDDWISRVRTFGLHVISWSM